MSAESGRISPRSWLAVQHDPPVLKTEWVVDRDLTGAAFLHDARRRGGWDDVGWERLLRHGGMHLDRRRLDASSPLVDVAAGTRVVAYAFVREPAPLTLPSSVVLLDEQGLVAVNKPPFFTVQGSRASRLTSLERALREMLHCPTLTPAHRLDRETSGVLVFARDGRAAGVVGKQFAARSIRKEYLALVHPVPGSPAWNVEGRLVRIAHPAHSLFELRSDGDDGQTSRTSFEVVEVLGARALVRAFPHTGRTHQLRVHLASGGTPIVGDALYGRGWVDGAAWSADRLMLHARRLVLRMEARGPERELCAPIPADFPWGSGEEMGSAVTTST